MGVSHVYVTRSHRAEGSRSVRLFDSHAHLDAPQLRGKLTAVLDRAALAGVERVVTIGVTPSSSRTCIEIASRQPHVSPTAGYHPHWSEGATEERMLEIARLAQHPAVVAVGEIGLDYRRMRSPRRHQLWLFRLMLEIAVDAKRPVIIHDGAANADVFDVLKSFRSRLRGGIIHCFSGDWVLANKYLDWGFWLSITGRVTFSKFAQVREVAAKMPLDQMLLETDAPHLKPAQVRGRWSEPAHVRYTAEEVARIRGVDPAEVADATFRNTHFAMGLPLTDGV